MKWWHFFSLGQICVFHFMQNHRFKVNYELINCVSLLKERWFNRNSKWKLVSIDPCDQILLYAIHHPLARESNGRILCRSVIKSLLIYSRLMDEKSLLLCKFTAGASRLAAGLVWVVSPVCVRTHRTSSSSGNPRGLVQKHKHPLIDFSLNLYTDE